MATTRCTIVGVFDDFATAERVAHELTREGIGLDHIQVTGSDSYAADAARGNTGLTGDRPHESSGGGISGFFHRLFGTDVEDDERGYYAEAVRRGSAVVAVDADDDLQDRVTGVMERYNPVDIDTRAESWRERGYTGYDASATPLSEDEVRRERQYYQDRSEAGGEHALPVVQEELQVGKRAVQRGGVRVYRRMNEQPVEEKVDLREEHVRVDRRPANRPATEADLKPAERVIEVKEMAEEPVIGKRARVVEEVVVNKETTTRTETVRDNIRRSDVQVEQLGREAVREDAGDIARYDDDFRNDFRTRYASESGVSYSVYAPAYRYGYTIASNPKYSGRRWEDIESTIRTDYERQNPNSTWERMKGAVRYGWERVTGKR